jgi:cyanophycin synthetase
MARTNPGDLVVLCADQTADVFAELEEMTRQAQPGSRERGYDPDLDPDALSAEARTSGAEADAGVLYGDSPRA